jgi:hypothetical protein
MQGTVEELQRYSKLDANSLQILFDYYTNCWFLPRTFSSNFSF